MKQYLLDHRDQFRDFPESDASMANLFKSGEAVIADGGRGTTEAMIRDGVPAEWIAPKEGVLSWVCGLAITSSRREPRRRLQADQLLRLARGPGDLRRAGLRRDEPEGAAADTRPSTVESADPASLETAIPETQPSASELYDRAWQEVAAG